MFKKMMLIATLPLINLTAEARWGSDCFFIPTYDDGRVAQDTWNAYYQALDRCYADRRMTEAACESSRYNVALRRCARGGGATGAVRPHDGDYYAVVIE